MLGGCEFEKLRRSAVDASSKCLLGVAPRDRWRLDFVALDSDASRRSEKVEG